eukprot:SAG11_NODE_2048_length_3884_cov_1.288507_2_plen_643_part_00
MTRLAQMLALLLAASAALFGFYANRVLDTALPHTAQLLQYGVIETVGRTDDLIAKLQLLENGEHTGQVEWRESTSVLACEVEQLLARWTGEEQWATRALSVALLLRSALAYGSCGGAFLVVLTITILSCRSKQAPGCGGACLSCVVLSFSIPLSAWLCITAAFHVALSLFVSDFCYESDLHLALHNLPEAPGYLQPERLRFLPPTLSLDRSPTGGGVGICGPNGALSFVLTAFETSLARVIVRSASDVTRICSNPELQSRGIRVDCAAVTSLVELTSESGNIISDVASSAREALLALPAQLRIGGAVVRDCALDCDDELARASASAVLETVDDASSRVAAIAELYVAEAAPLLRCDFISTTLSQAFLPLCAQPAFENSDVTMMSYVFEQMKEKGEPIDVLGGFGALMLLNHALELSAIALLASLVLVARLLRLVKSTRVDEGERVDLDSDDSDVEFDEILRSIRDVEVVHDSTDGSEDSEFSHRTDATIAARTLFGAAGVAEAPQATEPRTTDRENSRQIRNTSTTGTSNSSSSLPVYQTSAAGGPFDSSRTGDAPPEGVVVRAFAVAAGSETENLAMATVVPDVPELETGSATSPPASAPPLDLDRPPPYNPAARSSTAAVDWGEVYYGRAASNSATTRRP